MLARCSSHASATRLRYATCCARRRHDVWQTSTPRRVRRTVLLSTRIGVASVSEADKLFVTDEAPEAYLGPVEATLIKGKGRGLHAARTAAAGELLLVAEPLAVVTHDVEDESSDGYDDDDSADGETAEPIDDLDEDGAATAGEDDGVPATASSSVSDANEQEERRELVTQLMQSRSLRTARWLAVLDDGTERSQRNVPNLSDMAAMMIDDETHPAHVADAATAVAAAAAALDAESLARIVARNSYADRWEDATLGALKQLPSRYYLGLWPEYALINHSCIPNTSSYVFQQHLFVRAARSIAKQGELLTNYLVEGAFAPVERRQQLLQQQYGFSCRCARCVDEQKQDANLRTLINDIYDAVTEQLRPDLQTAMEYDNLREVENIRDQASTFVELLDAAFSKLNLAPQSQIWLQASVLGLYELLALSLAVLDESDPRLLELLQALAATIDPGSETHLRWAAEYREEIEGEEGRRSASFRHADKLLLAAHVARYGHVSKPVHARLAASRGAVAADEWG